MDDLAKRLDDFIRENKCTGITVWPSGDRWQANVQNADKKSWRVMFGDTPSEALHEVIHPPGGYALKRERETQKRRRNRDDEDLI